MGSKWIIRRCLWAVICAPGLLTMPACSLKTLAVRGTAEVLEDGIAAFEAEPDPVLAHEAAASQIKMLEALHRADPFNERVLLCLTRALAGYALAFLEPRSDEDPSSRERAARLYERGRDYGLALLRLRLGSATEWPPLEGFEAWNKRIDRARPGDVPVLFWSGYNAAFAARKSAHSPKALATLPYAVRMIERVTELDPSYHFGAAHLALGVYFADRPRMAGGDPAKAREHFEKARRMGCDRFVLARLLEARYLAVQTQDRALFRALLSEVLAAPDDLLPAQRLTQEVAKSWGRSLMKREEEYFAED